MEGDRGGGGPAEARFPRPFAIEAGAPGPGGWEGLPRVSGTRLTLLSLVAAAREPEPAERMRPERTAILERCRRAQSIVELAAELDLPVGLVKLVVADMLDEGALHLCTPSPQHGGEDLLHAVLTGLRAL